MFQIESWKNPYKHKYDSKEYWRERCKFYQYEYLMYFVRTAGISNDKNKIENWISDNCDQEGLLEANEKWNKTDSKCVKFYEMLEGKDSDSLVHLWHSNK